MRAGSEKVSAYKISLRSFILLTNLSNLETLSTLITLISYGPTRRNAILPPKYYMSRSTMEVTTIVKSNLFQEFLIYI